MAIQRIESRRAKSRGWQARAHVAPGERLTRFFADQLHGGIDAAYAYAMNAEAHLQRQVRRMRRHG